MHRIQQNQEFNNVQEHATQPAHHNIFTSALIMRLQTNSLREQFKTRTQQWSKEFAVKFGYF